VKQLKSRLSPQGRLDYFAVLDTLLEQRQGRENRFMDEFEKVCERLSLFPEMGVETPILGLGLRRVMLWNYHVFYHSTDIEVIVERIIHGARDLKEAFFED
jgi:toxin ParE1/3/4